MRYASGLFERSRTEEKYRIYVTDVLKSAFGVNKRYVDWVRPQEEIDVDAVIDDVISRAGLEVIE